MKLSIKKIKWIIFILVLFLLLIWVLLPRSEKRMQKIAFNEVMYTLDWKEYKDVLEGPRIRIKNQEYVDFYWYHQLAWGDTAAIYVRVWKSIWSSSLRNYIWASISMNYQWTYLEYNLANQRSGNFRKDILCDNLKNQVEYHISSDQKIRFDNSELFIIPDKLFFYLKEGYFEVLERKNDTTVVAFYEPIGNIFVKGSNSIDTSWTLTAKVIVNTLAEVLIIPYDAPIELWNEKKQ